MSVRDELTAEGRRFFKELEELAKLEVRVGFQAGEAEHDGVDMTDIAMWNELGTRHVPPRPFLRQSVDGNEGKIKKMCEAQMQAIAKGGTAEEAMNAIGIMQKGLIQETIAKGSFAPNAPSTIKRKGSSKPLIDTGRMRQSVNFVIQPKGQGD